MGQRNTMADPLLRVKIIRSHLRVSGSFFVVLKTNHRAGNFRLPQRYIISSNMRKEIIGSGNEIVFKPDFTQK